MLSQGIYLEQTRALENEMRHTGLDTGLQHLGVAYSVARVGSLDWFGLVWFGLLWSRVYVNKVIHQPFLFEIFDLD